MARVRAGREPESKRGGARPGAGRPPTVEGYGPVRKVRFPLEVDRLLEGLSPVEIGAAIAARLKRAPK